MKKETSIFEVSQNKSLILDLIKVVKEIAGYGEEVWDECNFRDGYKKVNSGVLVDARMTLKKYGINFEE